MSQNKKPIWQDPLKFSIAWIISSLLLIVIGFASFNPALINAMVGFVQEKTKGTETKEAIEKQIKEEVEKQVKTQVEIHVQEEKKILATQKALLKIDEASGLGREYISGEISKQATEKAEKVAKDEISQAKGDLFGQVTFPIIFAIASIFAAFAVKDILTEILKDEKKEEIKKEILRALNRSTGLDLKLADPDEDIPIDPNESISPTKPKSSLLTQLTENLDEKNRISITNLSGDISTEIKEFKRKLAWMEYELSSLAVYVENSSELQKYRIEQPDILQTYLNAHFSRIDRTLRTLIAVDQHKTSQIELLEAYEVECNKFQKNHGDEVKTLPDTNSSISELMEIRLAKASLILSEVDRGDINHKNLQSVQELRAAIEAYRNDLNTMKETVAAAASLRINEPFPPMSQAT
jgi:hypothetical protein